MNFSSMMQVGLLLVTGGPLFSCSSSSTPPPTDTKQAVDADQNAEATIAALVAWNATFALDYTDDSFQREKCPDGGEIGAKVTDRDEGSKECADITYLEVEFENCRDERFKNSDLGGKISGKMLIAVIADDECLSESARFKSADLSIAGDDRQSGRTYIKSCAFTGTLDFTESPYRLDGKWCGKSFRIRGKE